jgi:NADH-quinone oxidoreductase subunit L
VVLATLSLFFIFSPDPLDGGKGWFMHLVQTPATVIASAEAAPSAPAHGEAVAAHEESAPAAGHEAAAAAGEAHGPVFTDARQAELAHLAHQNHFTAIYLSSAMLATGILLAFVVYVFRIIDPDKTAQAIRPLYLYSFNKWYWDEIYDATIIKGSILISKVLAWFDANIVDGIVNGVATIFRKFAFLNGSIDKYVVDGMVNFTAFFVQTSGAVMRKIQTGKVQTYLVMVMVAVLGYFAFYFVQLMK